MLSNREIASAVWLAIFSIWVLSKPSVRRSVVGVIHAFLEWRILACVGSMLIYTGVIVVVLRATDFWQLSMAKDTVLWFCFTAFVMVMRFSTSRENENVAKTIIADTIKITILLEFLVGRFSFSLPVELLLVPFVSLVVLLDAFSRLDEQHADVAKLTNWTLTTTGFVILGFAAWSAICDWRDLGAIETVRSIAFPPLMSLLFIPFVYSLLVVASYESLFVRLQLGKDKAPDVVLYAKRRIFLNCQLSLSRLRKLTQRPPNELMQVESTADVDLALARTSLVKTESATDV